MYRTGRLKLSFWKSVTHYWPVFLILVPPIYVGYSLLEIYVFGTYDGVRTAGELISGTWIWIPIAFLILVIQWYRLNFKIVETIITADEFNEALNRTAEELNWILESNNNFSVIAFRNDAFMLSWGEMITIFCKDNKLYINAIPNPNGPSALTSFGWCKKKL